MRAGIDIPPRPEYLRAAVLGLVGVNRLVLRERRLPPLYASGVVYRAEALGSEHWQRADQVLRAGYGDCEDLAAWRVAELQEAGELLATVDVVKTGPRKYHARVMRASGAVEDPSRDLRRKGHR